MAENCVPKLSTCCGLLRDKKKMTTRSIKCTYYKLRAHRKHLSRYTCTDPVGPLNLGVVCKLVDRSIQRPSSTSIRGRNCTAKNLIGFWLNGVLFKPAGKTATAWNVRNVRSLVHLQWLKCWECCSEFILECSTPSGCECRVPHLISWRSEENLLAPEIDIFAI
jgi:hypothetical protein